jgi:prolipoprotein diacylglyceryltransferase
VEFTLVFAALTGVVATWAGVRLLTRAGRIPEGVERPTDLLIGAALVGLAIGRLAAMIGDGVNPITHPGDALIVRSGVDTGVASLAAVGALAWSTRARFPDLMDALAPAALAGLAGWQAGCLWRGTCLGTPSELPWAWALTDGGVSRHPTELYAALLLTLAALVVAWLPPRPWVRTGAALAAAAASRLVTQPIRPSLTGGATAWYVAGVVAGVGVLAWGLSRRDAREAPR